MSVRVGKGLTARSDAGMPLNHSLSSGVSSSVQTLAWYEASRATVLLASWLEACAVSLTSVTSGMSASTGTAPTARDGGEDLRGAVGAVDEAEAEAVDKAEAEAVAEAEAEAEADAVAKAEAEAEDIRVVLA
jgi:hypothetical protein